MGQIIYPDLPGGNGGVWQLIEEQSIGANTSTVTFSGLDGNADVRYHCLFHIINASGSQVVYGLRPNALTANQSGARLVVNTGGLARAGRLRIWTSDTSNTRFTGSWTFDAKVTGQQRKFQSHIAGGTISAAPEINLGVARWEDTVTPITSLAVVGENAGLTALLSNSIGAGSFLKLYKWGV